MDNTLVYQQPCLPDYDTSEKQDVAIRDLNPPETHNAASLKLW